MSERVLTSIVDHVATVTLNRASKRNAVDMEMFVALIDASKALRANSSVRAVVIHGDGEHFSAGIDLTLFEGAGMGARLAEMLQPLDGSAANLFQSAATVWRDLPVPVIAALQGTVFGAGLQIAMGADIRYAAPDVKMSIMEIKWGLIPDMAITTTLPGVVAQDKVKELAWTGRLFSADEAVALGFVTGIDHEPLSRAQMLARDIAARSPEAIRAIKTLINESWKDDSARSLRREAELQAAVLDGANQAEAVSANMEKRPPGFIDPEP